MKFEKEYREAWPETLGEKDIQSDMLNYSEYLENRLLEIREAQNSIDNKSSLKLPEWEKIVDFVDGGGIIGGNNWDGRMWTAGHIVYDIMVGNIKL